jgi:membrane associated rhomboid family serine protease
MLPRGSRISPFLDIPHGCHYPESVMAYRTYNSTIQFGMGGGIPPAVKQLLIVNTAAFVGTMLLQAMGAGTPVRYLMLTPFAVTHLFYLWQPVTYLFLHGGFFHILFNMLTLWMFGSDLERAWGTRRFLFYYFLTGVGAGLCVVLVSPSSTVATLGASGAIYGLLLAFGMMYPDRQILFFMIFPIPAKIFVMILGAIAFLSALSMPGDTVSHVGHLGGLLFGFVFLRMRGRWFDVRNSYYRWKRQRLQRKFQVYQTKRDREEGRPSDPDRWVN